MIKKCNKCKIDKSIDDFQKSSKTKDGLQYICKECFKEYYKSYRNIIIPKRIIYKHEIKNKVLSIYSKNLSPICVICEERNIDCLSIDHIKNMGTKHRRDNKLMGNQFYRWLKNNDFPDGYQTLCMNCNIKKQRIKEARELAMRFLKLYVIDDNSNLCNRCGRLLPASMFYTGNICKDCHYEQMYTIRRNKRLKIILHYSPELKCQRCGENDIDLLTIDHINGDGNIHRREKHHDVINHDIVKNNFPNGYQILCPNCQTIKRIENRECRV